MILTDNHFPGVEIKYRMLKTKGNEEKKRKKTNTEF